MGYLYMIGASLLFGIYPSIQDIMMLHGTSPLAAVNICLGLAGLFGLIVAIAKGENLKVSLRTFGALLLASSAGLFLTNYLLAVAYTMIPVGFATTIHFMFPTVVCLSMSLFFKEKFTPWKLAAIVFSVCGMTLLAGGDFSGEPAGIIAAGCTAFAYALFMISMDKTSASTLSPWARVAYTNLIAALCGVVMNLFTHEAIYPTDGLSWGLGLVLGVMLLCGFAFLNMGIDKLGAAQASFINMVEPLTSLVVSTLVFGYALETQSVVGCVLILGAMFFIALGARKAS